MTDFQKQAAMLAISHEQAKSIECALMRAYTAGVTNVRDWHRAQAKIMDSIIEDGETGRITGEVIARAKTWKMHHEHSASFTPLTPVKK
jgi:hypothetical protein